MLVKEETGKWSRVRIPEIGPHKCNQIYPLFLSDSMLMASTIILQIK